MEFYTKEENNKVFLFLTENNKVERKIGKIINISALGYLQCELEDRSKYKPSPQETINYNNIKIKKTEFKIDIEGDIHLLTHCGCFGAGADSKVWFQDSKDINPRKTIQSTFRSYDEVFNKKD